MDLGLDPESISAATSADWVGAAGAGGPTGSAARFIRTPTFLTAIILVATTGVVSTEGAFAAEPGRTIPVTGWVFLTRAGPYRAVSEGAHGEVLAMADRAAAVSLEEMVLV